MNTDLFKLSTNDALKSAISAVFAAIVVAVGGIVTQPGFDVFTVDYHALLNLIINVSVATFIGDIARRFGSDRDGKLFGKF